MKDTNPFQYGKVVSEPYFVDREQEIEELKNTLEGGNNIILYAPRRYGKTSLILQLLKRITSKNTVYLDFFSITSLHSFIEKYLNQILQTQKISVQRIAQKINNFIKGITPAVSFDNQGNPTWSFQFMGSVVSEKTLSEVISLPQKLAKNESFFIVFDEFQEIAKFNGDSFEKQLRAIIQHQDMVNYVFMGSKTHLLLKMFSSKDRALYHSGKLFALGKIDACKMHKYILHQFQNTGKTIENEIIDQIIDTADNIPYYDQFLAAQVWQLLHTYDRYNQKELLDLAVENILENQNEYYFSLFDHLTLYQRSVLQALIEENNNIFSQDYQKKYGLSTPSSTQRAVKSMVESGILEKFNESYQFSDPFLKRWIKLRICA